jgi:hypothetical protein
MEKVDVCINVFGKPWQTLCTLKTLRDMKRSDPSFYALKEIFVHRGTAENTMNNYSSAKIKYNIA